MAESNDRRILDAVTNAVLACDGLSDQDQLFALEMAWLATASRLRNVQLMNPGGFPAERERQAAMLDRMAELVRSDTPDLELERLWQEEDHKGVVDVAAEGGTEQ
jgi:hypothetical protein